MKKFTLQRTLTQQIVVEGNSIEEILKNVENNRYISVWSSASSTGKIDYSVEEISIPKVKELNIIKTGDIVELYSFEELIEQGFKINNENQMIFERLDLDINVLKEITNIYDRLKTSIIVDSEGDFKIFIGSVTLPNELIKA